MSLHVWVVEEKVADGEWGAIYASVIRANARAYAEGERDEAARTVYYKSRSYRVRKYVPNSE